MPKPTVFSYVRFSSAEQAEGDSERRQIDAAQKYAAKHGLQISEETYSDLGISAFRGKNITDGALGSFVKAVEAGKIARDSVLVIENLDRFSRDKPLKTLVRLAELFEAGISIVTADDGKVYDAESFEELEGFIGSTLQSFRAHGESKRKSKMVTAAWREKQRRAKDGFLVTSKLPGWLKVPAGATRTEQIQVIPERAKTVQRIFAMSAAGHGHATIARTLNSERIPPFGRGDGWHRGIIAQTLRDVSVIGTYVPYRWEHTAAYGRRRVEIQEDGIERVPGYYPAIIDEPTFYSIKHQASRPSGKHGGPVRDLLRGLAVCAKCGHPLYYKNKGGERRGQYYQCSGRDRWASCDMPNIPYAKTLDQVFDVVRNLEPYGGGSEVAQRQKALDALAGQIEDLQTRSGNLLDQMEQGSKLAGTRLAKLESELEELRAIRQELEERNIASGESNGLPPSGSVFQALHSKTLHIWTLDMSDQGTADLRAYARQELHRLIDRIEVEGFKGKTGTNYRKPPKVKVIPRPGIRLTRSQDSKAALTRDQIAKLSVNQIVRHWQQHTGGDPVQLRRMAETVKRFV